MKSWNHGGQYLERFPASFRGTIGDRFCRAIRDGCEDVKAILEWVAHDLKDNDGEVWKRVQRTAEIGGIDVWEFAEHMLERENLPWEEKMRLKKEAKAENSRKGAQVKMAKDAPTWKQLKYLKGLQCPIVPTTKLEAHQLIEQYKASKPMTLPDDLGSEPF